MTTTTERSGLLDAEQLARAEALRVAANVLGGRPLMSTQGAVPSDRGTDEVLALAEWLLDGTRELEAATREAFATLEAFDTHSDESDEPTRTDVRATLTVPEVYRGTDAARLVIASRDDLRSVLARVGQAYDSGNPGVSAYDRLVQAARA